MSLWPRRSGGSLVSISEPRDRTSRQQSWIVNNEATLGRFTLIALVISNMLGAGVFTTSGFAMGDLGSPVYVLLAWFIGGLLALCGAISYGAL